MFPVFLNPLKLLGDLIYGGSVGQPTRLAGNTSATRKFVVSQGTGSTAQAPFIDVLAQSDMPATVILAGGSVAFLASQSMGGNNLTNVADPLNPLDAVNLETLQAYTAAIDTKQEVQGATTAPLAAYTYSNVATPPSGVGATISLTTAAVLIVGGYTPNLGDRILIKNETGGNAPYNGIYTVTTLGTLIDKAVLTRATDFDLPSDGINGALVFVQNGTIGGTLWYCSTFGSISFSVTNISWSQFTGTTYTADGTTLTLTGTTFSINTGYTGQASIVTVGAIGTGTWQGTAVGVQYGGTGANLSATGGASQYVKQATTGASFTVGAIALGDLPSGFAIGCFMGGRLTLTNGTWLTTSDVTAATTLYYTPGGNVSGGSNTVLQSNGATVSLGTFTQLSIKLTDSAQTGGSISGSTITGLTSTAQLVRGMTLTASTGTGTLAANTTIATIVSSTSITVNHAASVNGTLTNLVFKLPASTVYDVYNVGGVLQFGNAWTSATARNDALGTLSGVTVNNAAINSGDSNSIAAKAGVYLGTIYVGSTAGQANDAGGGVTTQVGGQRFVWNMYQRRQRQLFVFDSTASWSYSTNSFRQTNNTAGNKVEVVVGLSDDMFEAAACLVFTSSNASVDLCGIGIDSTSANSAILGPGTFVATVYTASSLAIYKAVLPIGYHAINWLENADTSVTAYGASDTSPAGSTGLTATIWG